MKRKKCPTDSKQERKKIRKKEREKYQCKEKENKK